MMLGDTLFNVTTVFNVASSPPSITKWVWIALSTNNLCGALAAADNSQFFRILLPSHITGTWAYTKGSVTISNKLSSKLQENGGRHKKLILPGPKGVQYQKGETAKKPPYILRQILIEEKYFQNE